MDPQQQQHTRGLVAIQKERDRRQGFPRIPPRIGLWAGIVLAVWAIVYWKYTQEKVDRTRNQLLAKQRDAAAQLGPRLIPLRDKLEQWIAEAAGTFPGDLVTAEAKSSSFRSRPGVYLRELQSDAIDVKTRRLSALDSLRDGFTACLMRQPNVDPWVGPECKLNHDCPAGQHCNETHHCTTPAQPFNLRIFYRASHVLTDDWIKDVRDADDDMRLRLLERDYDSTIRDDIPLAIDMMARGQFFLLAIDELAEGGVAAVPDAGASVLEALETIAHPTRVFLYDIGQSKQLLRVRITAGTNEPATISDIKTMLAVRRQANSCALALAVRHAVGDEDAQ